MDIIRIVESRKFQRKKGKLYHFKQYSITLPRKKYENEYFAVVMTIEELLSVIHGQKKLEELRKEYRDIMQKLMQKLDEKTQKNKK